MSEIEERVNDNTESKRDHKKISIPIWLVSNFVAFGLGLLASWLFSIYSDYSNRPILNIYPKGIVISQELAGNWVLKLDANLVNSGNSVAIVEFKSLKLLFPSYSDQYYSLKADKIIRIDDRSSLEEKFTLTFPNIFDSIKTNEAPLLLSASIEIVDLNSSEKKLFNKDSSNIFMRAGYTFHEDAVPDSNYTARGIKPTKGHLLLFKPVNITYKGKNYLNYAFPPDEIVEYKIKDDKIYIFHASPPSESLSDRALIDIPIFRFIPHEKLKDKILMKEQEYVVLQFKNEKNEYKEYQLSIKSKRKSFVYLFKQN